MKKIIWGIVAIVIIILIISISRGNKATTDAVKIGYFGPFTGALAASTGEAAGDGFKLAESERSASDGRKIEVIYEDDGCDPKKAVSAAQKLIDVDKVKVLVSGVCSASTLAVAPIAEQNKVILITPISAAPKISSAGDYVFRLSSPTTGMSQAVVSFLEKKGYTKVGLLFENNEYPLGWKDTFTQQFKGQLVTEGIPPGSTDVKSQLTKISQSKPQAYVFTAISPAVANAILKQFRELGLTGTIVGNDTFSLQPVITQPAAEGIYAGSYAYDLSSDAMMSFVKNYVAKFNHEPKEAIYAALAYDTYNALYDAMQSCGDDTDCIKGKLYALKNVNGVSGTYSIDENGDTQRTFMVRKVNGGKLVEVK